MSNKPFTRATALAALIAVMLTLTVPASAAIDGQEIHNLVTPIAAVNTPDNDNVTVLHEYDDGKTPVITPIRNADGTYCVCVNEGNSTLKIFELDADSSVGKTVSISCELDEVAAFTKGNNGKYYALYAARLGVNDRTKTALKLVEYNGNGVVSRFVNIPADASGSLTTRNLLASSGALCANDKYVTGYIGKQMFPDSSGYSHQASYAFAVNMSSFSLVHSENSTVIPYASHSFHQEIINDGEDFLFVDRADCYPRAFHLTKMSGSTWTKSATADSFTFKGDLADNNTYGQLGGVIPCSDGYLLVGTYQNKTTALSASSANLFVQRFAKQDLTPSTEEYLTDYSDLGGNPDGITTVMNPKAVRLSSNKIAVAYMLCNETLGQQEIRVMFIDNSGNVISDKPVHGDTANAVIPKFGKVMYNADNDTIDWFTIVNGTLVLNSLAECEGGINCPLNEPVTEIVPQSDSITVAEGQSKRLNVALVPADAVTYLDFSSQDSNIATVDSSGLLTGVAVGTTTVTVTAHNGVKAQISVTVTQRIPVTDIELKLVINPSAQSVTFDARDIQIDLADMLYYSAVLSPDNATNNDYDVKISNHEVLLWNKYGNCFKPLNNGVCVVEFYSISDPSISKAFTVTVGNAADISVTATEWSWTTDGQAQLTVTYSLGGSHTLTINGSVSSTATPATCTQAGSTAYTATAVFNSKTYTDTKTVTIPATGHSYGEWITVVEPTPEEYGQQERTCIHCGNVEARSISAAGHSEVTDPAVNPTCTTDGKTQGSHCSICGEVIVAQETIPALGHSFGAWKTVTLPTPDADGQRKRVCSVCGAEELEAIPRPTLTSIEIAAQPTTTTYTYKSTASTQGLKVNAIYSDGSEYDVTSQAKVTGLDTSTKGSHTATVEFEGKTASFSYTVKYAWWQWLIKIVLFGWIWY